MSTLPHSSPWRGLLGASPARSLCLAIVLAAAAAAAAAGVPEILHYQGRVTVAGQPFSGTGQFRFALVNRTGSQSFWSHDATSQAGSMPSSAVSLPVVNGHFLAPLGDTSIAQMSPLAADIFTREDVRVRVWFDDGTRGPERLVPDTRITSVGYAMMAASVTDGSVTSPKLADDLEVSGSLRAAQFLGDGSQLSGLAEGRSVFVRWGSRQAPPGSQRIYAGYAFGAAPGHPGGGGPIVLAAGDPGPAQPANGSELYPLATATADMPIGIVADRLIHAAVCLADGPTTVIWGTWQVPPGWSLLYRGYAAGAAFSQAGSLDLICLDANAFDATQAPGTLGVTGTCGRVFISRTGEAPPTAPTFGDYLPNHYVKAAVIVKNPAAP